MNSKDLLQYKGKSVDEVIELLKLNEDRELERKIAYEDMEEKLIRDFIEQKYHKLVFHESAITYASFKVYERDSIVCNTISIYKDIVKIEERVINKLWLNQENKITVRITPITKQDYDNVLLKVNNLITELL